jgi:predicted secreted protein
MAFLHGKSASFQIDNSAGSLTNISAYCNDVSISRSFETAETTTFGVTGSAKTYIMGLTDATISVSGSFDANGASSVDGVLSGILGQAATVSFEYKASSVSTSATNPAYTGECFLTSYEVSAPVGDVVTFSAEFQVTGVVTRAVA